MQLTMGNFFRKHSADRRILVGFLVLAVVAFGLAKLASEVMEGDFYAFDRWLLEGLRRVDNRSVPLGPHWLGHAMIDITALGGVTVLAIVTALATGYLMARRRTAMGLFVAGAIVSGGAMSTLLKLIFARQRPDLVPHLIDVRSLSFPSGHAMNSAIVYLTLGALLARVEKRASVRVYLLSAAITLTLIIGFSRVYLGVHWPSDVIAGWCVGATWAVLSSLAARALQQRRAIDATGA